MRRREFLGLAAGAGVLGALWRPKGADVAVSGNWTKLTYGTDLTWTATNGVVTVGNGIAYLLYRRFESILFWKIAVQVGSTTSIPTGVWTFGMPPEINFLPTSFGGTFQMGSGIVAVAAAADAKQHLDVMVETVNPTSLAVELIPMATSYDGGTGQLQNTVPGTWAAGDFFVANGWASCLDN